MSDLAFKMEFLKLMLQVAWADDVITPQESELMIRRAQGFGVSAEFLDTVKRSLKGEIELPPPNLALLRDRADEAMKFAVEMMQVDGEAAEELEMIQLIKAFLGV